MTTSGARPDLTGFRRRLACSARLQAVAEAVVWERRGDARRLLPAAEFAGGLAWHAHGGRFALPLVEEALRQAVLPPDADPGRRAARVEGRTLHVLTRAFPMGGHTRLVRRWIELMDGERHAVALVRQRSALDPGWLVPPGRDVPVVDLWAEGVRRHDQRAAAVAALLRAAARVVLHIHPDDAVSVAAAHQAAGADLRLLNHADHAPWLGAALPLTLLNFRPAGARLAVARRGIPAGSMDVVHLPITPQPLPPRAEARAALGLGAHDVLLLTIASRYKYDPLGGASFEAPLAAALRRPEVKLVAIGPGPRHPVFSRLARSHPGRVRSLRPTPALATYRAAADFYVDSYPLSSATSMLESALLGTPVLAYQPGYEALEVFYSECPGLPRSAYVADTPEGFAALLEGLVDDEPRRRALSAALRQGMRVHLLEAWRPAMEAHLGRRLGGPGWRAEGVTSQDTSLDALLAGVGRNPLWRPGMFQWLALGRRGAAALLAERLRAATP
jgi:hypothetical protein